MKKSIYVIYGLLISAIFLFFILIFSSFKQQSSGNVSASSFQTVEDYYVLEDYKEIDYVKNGHLETVYNRIGFVSMEQKEILVDNPTLFSIEGTYDTNEKIGNYLVEFPMKVIEIKEFSIVVYCLSTTRVSLSLPLSEDKLQEDYFVKISSPFFVGNISETKKTYNFELNTIDFEINLENKDGKIIPGLECRISVHYKNILEYGLYVHQNYVNFIEGKYFVYKVFNIHQKKYYQPIEVKVLNTFNQYYQIESSLIEVGNAIVCL